MRFKVVTVKYSGGGHDGDITSSLDIFIISDKSHETNTE